MIRRAIEPRHGDINPAMDLLSPTGYAHRPGEAMHFRSQAFGIGGIAQDLGCCR